MALQELIEGLRQEEQQLTTQLLGIRNAISALEDGTGRTAVAPTPTRKRGTLSAKGRAAIAAAQKARWAKIRAANR